MRKLYFLNSSGERWPLLLHAAGTDARAGAIRLETARGAFLGRGERLDNPAALGTPCPEGDGETGAVLDACMSLRLPLRVEAGATARVWFVTAAVEEEEKARSLSAQYMARDTVLRALELSRMQEEVTARYLSLDENARLTAQRMASWLLWPLCAQAPCLAGRQALWRLGMSGDVPVVLAEVSDMSHLPLARLLVRCHAYLRALGLWSDGGELRLTPRLPPEIRGASLCVYHRGRRLRLTVRDGEGRIEQEG